MSASGRAWLIPYAIVIGGFLAVVASYYRPGIGFTAFLTLSAGLHDSELAAVRAVPHFSDPTAGYDGQFYAQLALDPLLRDPAIDRALDLAPNRGRRILLSWTAYGLGLGKPAWVLNIFALQNVACWLLLAWVLLRWFPVGTARTFWLWAACLLAHGTLTSVRYALLDGPSVLLVAFGVIAAEKARPWLASAVIGVAGLARETNLLAAALLARFFRRSPRSWLVVSLGLAIAALPLLLWFDYLRSIYVGDALPRSDGVGMPLAGLGWKIETTARALASGDWSFPTVASAAAVVAFLTQVGFVCWATIARTQSSPWLAVALSFAGLGLISQVAVWDGSPGAVTRVTLPLTVGFNVVARSAPWPLLVAGNLTVLPGVLWFARGF